MTESLIHSLNIGTLATWLSVGGFGTVAVVMPEWRETRSAPSPTIEETQWIDQDFLIGDVTQTESDSGLAPETTPAPAGGTAVETWPMPPELEPLAQFDPLPDLPAPPPPPAAVPAKAPAIAQTPRPTHRSAAPSRAANGRPVGSSHTVAATGSGSGQSSGMSDSARLSAGRMPAPQYPSEARRKGQTGTVIVEFTVDSSGRVISAHAKSRSPWPLLDAEAVRTVRRWKFPPGGVMKLQRPIVFKLR